MLDTVSGISSSPVTLPPVPAVFDRCRNSSGGAGVVVVVAVVVVVVVVVVLVVVVWLPHAHTHIAVP